MSLIFNTQNLLWIIIAAVAVIVFIIWTYRQVMVQLSSPAGWALTLIRIAAVGLLLFTICEPAASIMLRRPEQANVILLVDTSDSMGISDRMGNRIQTVSRLLTEGWFESLTDRYHIYTYQFDERITPLTESAFDSLSVRKTGTDIGAALNFTRTRARLDDIAGVILMTDGNHTVGRDPQRIASGLGLPIYAVGVGDTLEPRDTAVISHLTNDVAYVDSKIPVEVIIRSRGYEGMRLPVTLSEGERVVDKRYIRLAGGGREQSVLLHAVPTTDGIRQYTVSVPVQDDELVAQNNRRSFSIKILKTRLGILYIEGSPRADMTFLKQTLKRDPNVELTSVLARPDGSFYPDPLPDTRSAWFRYDLIILGSIAANHLQPFERHIIDFVEQKGGGLIVLGGSKSFELGGYAGTPLGNLMPVRIPAVNHGLLEGLFLPTLTADGQMHGLTQLDDDPMASMQRWMELPPLPGIHQVGPAKPGATVLATHPTWQIEGQPAPVITVQRYGLGKVLAIATYDLWRWDMMMWETGGTNASYVRFWSNAVRWLTTREGSRRVRVATEKPVYRSGDPIVFAGQVYDESYHAIDGATISVSIIPKHDVKQQIGLELVPSSDGTGRYKGTVNYLVTGEYGFVASATKDGQLLGTDPGGFDVGEPAIEYDRTRMNRDLLVGLTTTTGGQFYHADEADRLLKDIDFADTTVTRTSDVRIWNHPLALLIFILMLSIEWLFRRRHGIM